MNELEDLTAALHDALAAQPAVPDRLEVVRSGGRRRRRRARTALIAGMAGVTLCGGLLLTGDGDAARVDSVDPGPPAPDELSVTPDTPWFEATLSKDGRQLTIQVGSSPQGTGPCEQTFDFDVVETSKSVTVAFDEQTSTPTGHVCPLLAVFQSFDVALDEPLGDRPVYDGLETTPRTVWHLADLVEVTPVSDGWVADVPYPRVGRSRRGWQQTFTKPGADWYFSVVQEPSSDAPEPEGTSTPVMVNGVEGQRYSGQMNNTMETIRWVEGDLTISVWGEMQGPPTFTHHDDLLAIAEGVRLPQS